ncbi:gliding motility-associated C-terminal domain-containing protein [Cognataquiflexum rubidum]|uniref:gliding motility-associated C-terminal domain-containing protein n=1 Tax=Cognataquiflexum rubidum TaxID=2922273 RepID=UPI001F13AC78|nr:gliding motility-associated C-terminal domain-containing protein [Cognataquiflexum rubidum]MCH6235572.1 gliding motility-associated C-terminal domain-containing protein [Cognataquiflexum rubidum]
MKSFLNYLIPFMVLIAIGQRSLAMGLEKELFLKPEFDAELFVNQTNEFGIVGPEELCLYYGSNIGEFFGGGLVTDVFKWKIIKADGSVLVDREGGFQTFSHTFSEVGVYEIQLNIRRGLNEVFSGTRQIVINKGADPVIENTYLLCNGSSTILTLLDPNTPNLGAYQVKWMDSSGQIVGTTNSIQVDRAGKYTAEFFSLNEIGLEVCPFSVSTYVYESKNYSLTISTPQVCNGGTVVTVSAGNSIFGNWYYKKRDGNEKVFLGQGSKKEIISTRDLQGEGEYDIIFEVDNTYNNFCKASEQIGLKVNQTADVSLSFENQTTNCGSDDGVLLVVALTDLDLLRVRRNGIEIARFENLVKGQEMRIPGLSPGLYTASAAFSGCSRTRAAVIPLANPPADMIFNLVEVIGETCNDSGKVDGQIKIKMNDTSFIGSFRLLSTSGAVIKSGTVDSQNIFSIYAPAGNYFLEISNDEGCVFPRPQRITIGSKGQVVFAAPERLTVCEYFDFTPTTNQNLEFTLTYPDNSQATKSSGESFRLDQSGEYILLGLEKDSQGGFCPRETSIFVTVTNQVQFEPELISRDCFGNRQYKANLFGADPSKFYIKWINEIGQVVGTEEFLFPVSSGEFKLEVRPVNSEACPIPTKSFIIEAPVLAVDVTLQATVLCNGGNAEISLDTDFQEVKTIYWIYIGPTGESMVLDQSENKTSISVTNPGTYEAVVYNDLACEIGRNLITITENNAKADFEVPERLVICDYFELIPDSALELMFTIISPDGEVGIFQPGEKILFSQNGEYTITSQSVNPNSYLCPVSKKIEVVGNSPISFEPKLSEQTCGGKLIFEAYLFGKSAAEVDVFWYNELGALVGNEQFLTPETYGIFTLEVRPKGSYPCPAPNSKEFEVIKPIIAVEGSLSATPFCSEGENVTVSLEANFGLVSKIQWYYRDFNGNLVLLKNFNGQREIVVSKEGTYEVEIFNKLGCTVGKDVLMVMRSMDESRPQVEETYLICPSLGSDQGINPGNFQKYEWVLNGRLLSEEAVFSPTVGGKYILTVTNSDGCTFSTAFEVLVECKVQVIHTTGMSTKDSQRPFRVYSNPLVNEVGVWIYNNWGQLVYQCSKQNLTAGNELCEWYGDFNGQTIETGTYAVKIIYKNNVENITKSIWSSVTVVD